MSSTYEEIEAEWQRLTTAMPLPPQCKAVMIAHMQEEAGLAIQSRCLHCGGLLKATDVGLGQQGSARLIACPCGRSKNLWRIS